jgi:flagellar hook-basal body complex protein FliE
MASSVIAAGAYAATQKLTGVGAMKPAALTAGIGGGGGEFAQMVQQFAGNAASTAKGSEKMMIQAAAGRADLVDVVTAISESEAALETLVAVRDKVIAAYEEIMRMPI